AGLSRQSQRGGLIDRFHRRLMWPIRDLTGDVIGFGARRLHQDDPIEAKYLNTPETPLYKKVQVLYGLDLAKREIGRQLRAVVVEPGGMDPCELRQAMGDAAVRDLVARRRPLVEFALRTAVERYDLDTAEGKVGAIGEAVPIVARIKDQALRHEYARRLAGMV